MHVTLHMIRSARVRGEKKDRERGTERERGKRKKRISLG